MGTNKVILLGYLGRDPELKHTPSGLAVSNLSVATNERWKDKTGQMVEKTEWHRVTVFGRMAENCTTYLRKGKMVYVEGRIETDKWKDQDGKDRYSTAVVAYVVQFIGGKSGNEEQEAGDSSSEANGDMFPDVAAGE